MTQAALNRQGNLGGSQDAAIAVQAQVLALIEWQHIRPKTELTPERMAVLQTVFSEVMADEDGDAIAQAAAQNVQQHVLATFATQTQDLRTAPRLKD